MDRPDIAGVVITHGTDTMEETAFFLNLVVGTDKPVVLVGAKRPATAISADGPMNLLNAAKTAVYPDAIGKGVLVVMNDQIHGARDVTKTNTTSTSTFESPVFGALGTITGGKPYFFMESVRPHTSKSEFCIRDIRELPRVDIVYAHANQDSVLVEACIKAGSKGIVYAGFGNGSIHKNAEVGLARAAQEGIIVVRTSRTGSGLVVSGNRAWTDMGFLNSGSLNPQKARILLQLALTKTRDRRKIERIFEAY